MVPVYRIAQRFVKLEAVNTPNARSADPADPLQLQVAVTPSNDIQRVVETVAADPASRDRLWRATQGHWIFQLNPALYQAGVGYTVHYRFSMTPNSVNILRQSFTWDPIPETAHDTTSMVVHGVLFDGQGLPISGGGLVVEQYVDIVALSRRTSAVDVITDPFGNWFVELPRGAIARFVFGTEIDIRKLPTDIARATYGELQAFQPSDVIRKDKYGYPFP